MNMTKDQLIEKVLISHSLPLEEVEEINNEIITFLKTASEDEKKQIREAAMENTKKVMSNIAEAKKMAEALLAEMEENIVIEKGGNRYDLSEWITPSEYAKKYAIKSAQIVSNWIARGLIPSENILKIDRLKLSLVRDIENIR